MLNVENISDELIEIIQPKVETLLAELKSGVITGYKGKSLSTAAAQKMVNLMTLIIESFRNYENLQDESTEESADEEDSEQSEGAADTVPLGKAIGCSSASAREKRCPEVEVVSNQVQRLLHLIVSTSDVLIRPQFGTLLLTNVTRRVLSIIRDAAQEARVSHEELLTAVAFPPSGEELDSGVDDDAKNATSGGTGLSPSSPKAGEGAEKYEEAQSSPTANLNSGGSTSAAQQRGRNPSLSSSGGKGVEVKTVRFSDEPSAAGVAHPLQTGMSAAFGGSMLSSSGAAPVVDFLNYSTSRSTDTKVSVPGQHALRRAPSQRDPNTAFELSINLMGNSFSQGFAVPLGITSPTLRRHSSIMSESSTGVRGGGDCSSPHSFPGGFSSLGGPVVAHEFPVKLNHFYDSCLERLADFGAEIDTMTSELCSRVTRQIHRGDVIITLGCTHTMREYLRAASERQTFRVFLLDGAPTPPHMVDQLARELTEKKISVQRLPDSSAFAVMNMCTKVMIGAESVLGNGGMLGQIGTRMLCVAARHFSVPVLVPTTTLKMSPYYPSDPLCIRLVRITKARAQELPWSIYGAPELVLPLPYGVWVDPTYDLTEGGAARADHRGSQHTARGGSGPSLGNSNTPNPRSHVNTPKSARNSHYGRSGRSVAEFGHRSGMGAVMSQVSVHCASTEYIPPELITLYATNESEFTPSQCHRVIRANYNDAD